MSDWKVPAKFGQKFEVGEVYCEERDYQFFIKALKGPFIIFIENDSELLREYMKHKITAKVFLYEWNEYRLVINKSKGAKVFSGAQEIYKDEYGDFYPLQYTNQLGRVRLRVEIEGKSFYLPEIEVISPKLNYKETEDELFYPKFYDTLRNE
ncbi:hypothetical protein H5T87_01245, partial [bacterium]|nr:hypothetical protein [bacterium]